MDSTVVRSTRKVVLAPKMKEGAGFIVARSIGSRQLSDFDPFLMLDHLGPTDYKPGEAVGAPWHPHRGFETVTYLLQGEMQHRDSLGNTGFLRSGDVQWMTAGSGIIHDEEPSDALKKKGGIVEGFQLWVNLPSKDKMCEPSYQDVPKSKIPEFKTDNFFVRVIAGEAFDVKAVVNTRVPIQYLDFHTQKGAQFTHKVSNDLNACAYVYRGQAKFGKNQTVVKANEMVVFNNDGSEVDVVVDSDEGCKFLFLAGKPINEPIAKYGPFVMNTQQEIYQAFEDYQSGKLVKHTAKFASKTEHETEYDPSAKDASIL